MFLLKEQVIGLDIADHTIEAVELTMRQGKTEVTALSRIQLEIGVVEKGRIKDEEKLAKAIKDLFAQAKPKSFSSNNINFALPDSQLFSHIFYFKKDDENSRPSQEEIEEAVLEEAKTNIPLPEEDLAFSYKILSQKNNEIEILLIAASYQVVLEWKDFFAKQKLDVEYFDAEVLATFRGIFNNIPTSPVCIVDIGSSASSISIFNGEGLHYSRYSSLAGEVFSQKLSSDLKIDFAQAEALKINQGLDGQNITILSEYLERMTSDIKEAIDYFKEKNGKDVSRIIFVGGSSKMKGLIEYFGAKLGLPVQVGDSEIFKNKVPLLYVEAVGSAIRSFDKKWHVRDPIIDLKNIVDKTKEKKQKKSFDFLYPEEQSSSDRFKPKSNLKKQKIILAVVLVVCVVSLFGARWYKNNENEKKEQAIKAKLDQFSQTQVFDMQVLVATKEEEYTGDRARGRIAGYKIDPEKNYNDSLNMSKEEVVKGLKSGEVLWDEPLDDGSKSGSIKWLVYLEKDVNSLFLSQLDEMNKDNVEYILNGIEKTKIESTDNENLVYLYGKLTILAQKLIEVSTLNKEIEVVAEQSQPVVEEVVEIEQPSPVVSTTSEDQVITSVNMVLIKDTPTGWLNVRQGPGTNYNIVFKVNPGETYEALEKENDWQKIKKLDGQEGWVSTKYVQAQ